MPHCLSLGEMRFFDGDPGALELYEIFIDRVLSRFPSTGIRVQKTQITLTNPRVFACVSKARTRRADELPPHYITVMFGLSRRVCSGRIDAAAEPYAGRWTHHVLISEAGEVDSELLDWIGEAYLFSKTK